MNRPHAEGDELSEAEKRDLIKLINKGKPLPEKYRFLLFQDKREVELVWNGKTREVCTAVLPFQTLEHIPDFSVYYSQGLADAIAADLKKGKSEVVCDAGALIKISKNKQGLITRDVLTKHWTDWVDYWAVDFNYESRREIIKVPKGAGVNTVQGHLPGQEPSQRELELPATDFEERWTGAYIFENEW